MTLRRRPGGCVTSRGASPGAGCREALWGVGGGWRRARDMPERAIASMTVVIGRSGGARAAAAGEAAARAAGEAERASRERERVWSG